MQVSLLRGRAVGAAPERRRAALAWAKRSRLPTASLERPVSAHRRAVREQLAHVDALRAELEAEGMATELLDGEQVARAAVGEVQPDQGRRRAPQRADRQVEVLGELDAAGERDLARQAALRLREQIAHVEPRLRASHQHVVVDRDVEQTILIANTAGRTQMGWLHGAMLTRQPFTLSVFVHALERRRERQRLKLAYRRLFTINRGAEQRGRVPDFDRYVQEREYRELLGELATGEQTGLFRVSVYQTLRARGPDPDLRRAVGGGRLLHRVDRVRRRLQGQPRRVPPARAVGSSLPLGPRPARAGRASTRPSTPRDMLPLIGTKCGSPTGVPFAFADPGRTVELINPYDEEHANHTLADRGRAGVGKTMTANVLLSRCLALGARAFVIDRAGHYETLTRLIDGAQQIEIGADDSPYALNPWDVPGSGEGLAGEDRVPARAAPGDDGRPGRAAARDCSAPRSAPSTPRPPRSRPARRASRCSSEELRAQAKDAQDADAVDVAATLRNLADRLSEYCGEGTYAYLLDRADDRPARTRRWWCSTPAAARRSELRLVMFAIMEYVTGTVERHWHAHRADASKPGRAAVPRAVDDADRRGVASDQPRRDRRVRQQPRPPRPPPRAGADRDVASSCLTSTPSTAWRCCGNSAQQLLLAQNPQGDPVHRRHRAALRTRGRRARSG